MVIVKTRLRRLIRGDYDTVYLHADEDVLRAYKMKMKLKEYARRFYNVRIERVMMSNNKSFKEMFKDESETFVFNRLSVDYAFFYTMSLREALRKAIDFVVLQDKKVFRGLNKDIKDGIIMAADILSSFLSVKSRKTAEKKLFYLLFNYSKMRRAVNELALQLIEEGIIELERKLEVKARMEYSFIIVPVVQWSFGHEEIFLRESLDLLSCYYKEQYIAVEDRLKISVPKGAKFFVVRRNEIIDTPIAVAN